MKDYIQKLEILLAVFCILIPIFLKIADGWKPFKPSISHYVLMENRHVFGMVITIAAMSFIYNGSIQLTLNSGYTIVTGEFWKNHGYNIFLGLFLFGVLLFPLDTHPKLHYFFAVLFFVGAALSIAFFGDNHDKLLRYIIAVLSVFALIIHILRPSIINMFWAEWIALFVVGIHFILEAKGIISLT